jgi:hypothetical protein
LPKDGRRVIEDHHFPPKQTAWAAPGKLCSRKNANRRRGIFRGWRHLETVLRVCVPTLLLWSDSGAATSGAQRGGKPGRPLREAMAIRREQLRGGKGTEQELLAFVAYLTPVEGEDHGQADRYGRDRRH